MLFLEISNVWCEKHSEYKTDCVDKMQIYFRYTRYQAAYITRVAATVMYKGWIQLPFAFQAYDIWFVSVQVRNIIILNTADYLSNFYSYYHQPHDILYSYRNL